jgi:hypothetical protein
MNKVHITIENIVTIYNVFPIEVVFIFEDM